MVIFGLSFVWFKDAYLAYRPLTVVFTRLTIAGVLLDLLLRVQGRNQKVQPGDRKWFMLMAFFEPFLYFIGESFGMQRVSPTLGAVIICTIPLITPAFAWMIVKERIDRWGVLGLVASFLGILATVWDEGIGGGSLAGLGFLAISVFAAVGYTLIVKSLAGRYSSLFIVKMMCQYAAVYFLPLFLIFELKHVLATPLHPTAAFAILKMAVLASGLAYVCLTTTIRNIGINNTNLFTFLIPVTAAIFSHFALGTAIGPHQMVGILMVGLGLVVSQLPWLHRELRRRRNQPPAALS